MGTIIKRKGKKRISYRAEVFVEGKRASRTFKDEIEARIWIRDKENALRNDLEFDDELPKGDMLFYDAMERYIHESRKLLSKSQINSYRNSEKIFRRTFNLQTKMSEITPQDISTHILKRITNDNVGPSSIRNELSFIRGIYTKASEWGIEIDSPEYKIKRPRAAMRSREERLDNVIKPDELMAIFKQAEKSQNNLYQYLKFLLYTGMRPSEAAHLYWERLPILKEKAEIKNKNPVGFIDLARGGFSKIGTKTEKRFVPAHPMAIEVIEQLKKSTPGEQEMVFLDNKYLGRHMAYKYYRRSFKTVTKNATIDDKPLRADINFYSFRHTFRSRLEECGVSTAFAESIIGHSDRSFKFTYIHLSDEALIHAIELLNYNIEI